MPRKTISKKLRFEVFKRDKFTCQYCGKKAPDVVLHVDHIIPVAQDGTNDIMNLVTSCQECNLGKSDKKLDDSSVLEKQRKQLESLQDRREQLKMLYEWKIGLENIEEQSVKMLEGRINEIIHPYSLSKNGEQKLAKLVEMFTIEDILDAIEISRKQYLRYNSEGVLVQDTADLFFNRIGGIIYNSKRGPISAKLYYVRGICKKRFGYWSDSRGMNLLNRFVKVLKDGGLSDDKVLGIMDDKIIPLSKNVRHWTEWHTTIEEWIREIAAIHKKRVEMKEDVNSSDPS